jgi:predicted Zn-dependent peptidase
LRQSRLVHAAGAEQTHLLLAAPVRIDADHADWVALQIACEVLGAPAVGMFDARIREQLGQSYGLRAQMTMPAPGLAVLTFGGAVGTEFTAQALAEMRLILSEVYERGLPAALVERARGQYISTTPMRLQTAGDLAAATADLASHGLPITLIEQHLRTARNLDLDTIDEAFRRHLDPAALTLVAIGDAGTIAAPVTESGLVEDLDVINQFGPEWPTR